MQVPRRLIYPQHMHVSTRSHSLNNIETRYATPSARNFSPQEVSFRVGPELRVPVGVGGLEFRRAGVCFLLEVEFEVGSIWM
jgi:hypothetical protein